MTEFLIVVGFAAGIMVGAAVTVIGIIAIDKRAARKSMKLW